MRVSASAAIAALFMAVAATSAVAVPVYSNNFEGAAPGAEWSNPLVSTTPGGTTPSTKYLGQFGTGSVTLSLNSLAPHDTLNVNVDLYLIQTWDGNGDIGGGPDRFTIAVDGTTLLDSTFSNLTAQTQTYPAPTSSGAKNPAQTGALVANSMGFIFQDKVTDAIYRLNLSLPHTGSTANIVFTSFQTEPAGDEGWGLDNVSVDAVGAAPIPLPPALFIAPLGAVTAAFAARGMRRRA